MPDLTSAFHVSSVSELLAGQPNRGCCIGDAVYGSGRCTCWESVYDAEQADPIESVLKVRSEMCADCAFRPDSPERSGDVRYRNSDGLSDLLESGRTFACHQGMRRRVALVHPDGSRISLEHLGSYAPAVSEGWAFRADGSPADICAGWDSRS